MMDRATFLRTGSMAMLGALAAPAAALGAPDTGLPAPAPIGDDAGFLQFGALAERVSLTAYRRALRPPGGWSAEERAALEAVAARRVANVQALTAALGADAPSRDDYTVALPERAFATRAGTIALLERLERLLVGVYVGGAAFSADAGTRLLLARVLASDAQSLAMLRALHGLPVVGGLPNPISIDAAGAQLDALLDPTGYPA